MNKLWVISYEQVMGAVSHLLAVFYLFPNQWHWLKLCCYVAFTSWMKWCTGVLTLGCKRRMSSIICWKSGCSYCTRLFPWSWQVLLHILINQAMLVLHGIPFMDTLPPCSPRILVRCLHDGKPPQPTYGSFVLAQNRYRPDACSVTHNEEPSTVLKYA